MMLESQMNKAMNLLGYPEWQAVWAPGKASKRGEVFPEDHLIVVYDESPSDAWDTFIHEVIELNLRHITRPYRDLVNALITILEKQIYKRKEEFIDRLPGIYRIVNEAQTK